MVDNIDIFLIDYIENKCILYLVGFLSRKYLVEFYIPTIFWIYQETETFNQSFTCKMLIRFRSGLNYICYVLCIFSSLDCVVYKFKKKTFSRMRDKVFV